MTKAKRISSRLIAVYQILGGLTGLAVMFFVFYPKVFGQAVSVEHSWALHLLAIIFSLLFLLSVVAGIFLWQLKNSGILLSLVVQLFQLPYLITNAIAYFFCAGLSLNLYFTKQGLGFFFYLGGKFLFFLHNTIAMQKIGVNVFALFLVIVLWSFWRSLNPPPNRKF